MVYSWRLDSLSCNERKKYVFKVDTMKVLKGIKLDDFINLFGRPIPNENKQNGQFYYRIFYSCDNRDPVNSSQAKIHLWFVKNKLFSINSLLGK